MVGDDTFSLGCVTYMVIIRHLKGYVCLVGRWIYKYKGEGRGQG